jgi:hypothetical protein
MLSGRNHEKRTSRSLRNGAPFGVGKHGCDQFLDGTNCAGQGPINFEGSAFASLAAESEPCRRLAFEQQ